ncbi:hypothetical protein O0I10_012204 [Lichtheimia ornata]|uniref:MPN domain-containing protein n=1 Tax=Lichtheimia ornata TaxID=688661 RepID=A0AAD7XTA5_9FUNG|nr:uncharacterized protein O0I10_012204 [Lichtheimia ornata]KAJ8652193.1 hypothetical protein O0I10_012204 [Lichtheimia ornata]
MTHTRPRTTAELNKLGIPEFNPHINIKHYFRSAELLLRQARVYRTEGDLENAYVLYLKYTNLGINELPKHPAYKHPDSKKPIKIIKLNCLEALDALETMKPRLDAAYHEHNQRLQRMQEEEEESRRRVYSSSKIQVEEESNHGAYSSDKIQEEEEEGDNDKTLLEEEDWSVQKALSGVAGIGHHNEQHQQSSRPAELPPLPARYPSHDVFRNQSDSRISYESSSISSPSPAAPPPPLPPKPAMPPPLPDRTNSVSPRAPVLPPKIKLEEQKAVELATTESGEPLRTLYVPTGIQEQFLRIARINTDKNIETCGILCGSLKNNTLTITTLIIPKQSGTPDTCTTENEEEVFEYQDTHDLLTLGWIHTHPSQSCFLSSLDLHTHCAYQIMLPEAIAIVCAPKHEPSVGVFRLTDPPGLSLISNCRERGAFHPHPDKPIYTDTHNDTGHVRMTHDSFKVVDLRC